MVACACERKIGVMSLRKTFLDEKDWRTWHISRASFTLNNKGDKGTGGADGMMIDSDDDELGGGTGEGGVVNLAELSDEERGEKQWCKQKKDEARRAITRFRLKLGGGGN